MFVTTFTKTESLNFWELFFKMDTIRSYLPQVISGQKFAPGALVSYNRLWTFSQSYNLINLLHTDIHIHHLWHVNFTGMSCKMKGKQISHEQKEINPLSIERYSLKDGIRCVNIYSKTLLTKAMFLFLK
jgi:hypothetical protein